MTRKETQTPVASARPRRTPLSVRNRLAIKNKEEGYVYRIVNDVDDRVSELSEQGYEIVPKEAVGAVGDKRVDATSSPGSAAYFSVGQGTKAVVMRQREDWYKEDQSVKQKQIDEVEQTMKQRNSDYGDVMLS